MPLSVWTQDSNYNFGIHEERITVNLPLPVTPTTGVTYQVISGNLPRGLRLVGSNIIGTPFEVSRTTEYKFVVRAKKGINFADRTFRITIIGSDDPQWLTPAGPLPVGANQAYYILDSSYIDFQLSAVDTDTAAGQQLKFFIASDGGELPPGLIMTESGRITGFVQPLLSVPQNAGEGPYDTDLFDNVAYDFGYRPTNGYDTYVYDLTVYDFFVPTGRPRKLNRNYEFIVTITDGDTFTTRKYRIYVVGDDFFRSDNVITTAGSGTYTADVTYVRSPIFTTPADLGFRRANNYQTFKIDTWEGFNDDLGPIVYEFESINARLNGMAIRETASDNRLGSTNVRITRATLEPLIGYKLNFNGEFTGATNTTYTIIDVDQLGGDIYRMTLDKPLEITIPNGAAIFIGDDSVLPPGMDFDPTKAEVFGTVPYQPAITKEYNFTIRAIRFGQGTEVASSRRVFSVKIFGEVDSAMSWNTPNDLGTILAGYVSTLFVSASSTYNGTIMYKQLDGKMPPGLSLNFDGEIVGKTNEIGQQVSYKGMWKPSTAYTTNNIVRKNSNLNITSIVRKKNTGFIVTETDHGYKDNSLVRIITDDLTFNTYSSIAIECGPIKINSRIGSGSNRVKFSIPKQKNIPLAPTFPKGSITGTPASNVAISIRTVNVKSTTGSGVGAQFKIFKPSDALVRYTGITEIYLEDPGIGYLPGDYITISGADLDGVDGINDMTFWIPNGIEYYYKVNGNSNSLYNGRFFATESSSDSITLVYAEDPGTFGSGTISVAVDSNTFEGQTQVTPLNYFSYNNKGSTTVMKVAEGRTEPEAMFYKALVNHTSGPTFINSNWESYTFEPETSTLTEIDTKTTTFDNQTTTLDRTYQFTIQAADPLGYSAIERQFTVRVSNPNQKYYSNLYAKPFLKQSQRDLYKGFINNYEIFTPDLIYRPYDPEFGIQRNLKMLVFAGIETKESKDYIAMMAKNHKPKRFKFGSVEKAVAKLPGTNTELYEIVYIKMIDPLEKQLPNGKSKPLPQVVKLESSSNNITVDQNNQFYQGPFTLDSQTWNRANPFYVSLDSTTVFAGDPGSSVRFPSSISLWRYRIKNMIDTARERNYLPLWMRSIQQGSVTELDYVAAVPICFCKPGGADYIMLNIKNHLETTDFDFKLIDFTIDRYIIDSVEEGYNTDKYLVFKNDRTSIT